MFEAHVLYLLKKYLGEYVEGLSIEALRISVWKGDVVLKDLKLKAEALNSLKLPIIVKAGFVGSITLKVPWKSLGKEPVIVLIDRVFVLAYPASDGHTLNEEDREKLFEAKLRQIQEAESATLEAASRRFKAGSPSGGNSWLGSLVATIIGNLKVSISNVHIRYEDSISNSGHPFCSGVTLSKLAAVTTDEQGNETFDTSGALDKLQKSLQLHRLALYHDSDSSPWKPKKKWEDLSPAEWTEIFNDGIDELASGGDVSVWAANRKYLVSPINGVLNYHRLGRQEKQDPEVPFEKASLVLSDVSLTISEAQYYDGIKLLETFSRYKTRVDISHLRPVVSISEDPYAWWHYAVQATLQQKKMCYRFSWERIRHLCLLRRRYIQLYVDLLQQSSVGDNSKLRQIEKVLDAKVVVLWRLLAHAKVESVKSKEASRQKASLRRNWWSFGWRSSPDDNSVAADSMGSQLVGDESLTKEEWHAINKMLSYQPDEDTNLLLGKDMQNMIQYLVDVSIGQAAARIINIDEIEVACGRFEQLHLTTKLYHKSIHCDVSLKYCGLSSPEGPLAQSVISEKKTNALAASFVHAPTHEDVDWRLSATISPCHVMVLMESYERFLEFVKRSKAVSPTVSLETVNALQMKIEQVTRRAQEQIQMVLEEKSRFALDIDFDAPKVRVPMMTSECACSYFLLDCGHFTLHTREGQVDKKRQSLYSRFYISGRDMAAFFIDSSKCIVESNITPEYNQTSLFPLKNDDRCYSLVDRCGMSVIVDQIKIPHPDHPSMRLSVQVPNLVIHFSPARHYRIMELLSIFTGSTNCSDQNASGGPEARQVPWHPSDPSILARILVWRGIGNSLAEWQPCFLILSGLSLYVFESELSRTYQRCSSLSGRQVFEVPPTSLGGSLHAVAVCSRGLDNQKALESSNTLIIEFYDGVQKSVWLKELVQATYRASVPPVLDLSGEHNNRLSKPGGPPLGNLRTADLVINGTLIELKVSLYGKMDRTLGSDEEALILELLAGGGKVNLVRLGGDVTVKVKLHSLKIKDELQGSLSTFQRYLACSVLKDSVRPSGSGAFELSEKGSHKFFMEDDESFTDALPDFMCTPDQSFYSQNPDWISNMVACSLNATEQFPGVCSSDASTHDKDKVKGMSNEIFYEARDSNISDFVAVTFLTRSPDSPLYDGVDTQMSIRMSKLEFFCNRPTIVALIGFGLDLSMVNSSLSSGSDMDTQVSDSKFRESKEDNGRALVKGLLGYGKARVVFDLSMDVDSVSVYLNKEDGSQLAMFVQESFLLDVKVHPSSLTIEGTLGNMRLCDMSIGPDHHWGWLCDIRNQETESLIKFTFQSYSTEDDDYQGYDYSLCGRLSAVRIVFLYRFVQEITSYFMELASPHSEEAIQLVDKVGGFEWLIQKYEIDGASAIKLDLSLDTPIIIIPKNSTSRDYMQLDLGKLQVQNSFSWHGCQEKDSSAVHLDILRAEIHGINMTVGVNGVIGKPMIREGQGLHIQVRRSLRDVFRKVPTLSVDVQVGLLECVMSDKEYKVILDCAYMNISEEPTLPPSFQGNFAIKDSIRMLADKVTINSQALLSHTVVVMAVEVHYALLELCNTCDEDSSLAKIALEGLWVSYRTTSLFESDLYITIPKFSVMDIRPDIKPEMRLMLGSYADVSKPIRSNIYNSFATMDSPKNDASGRHLNDANESNLTMLIMDYRWRPSFQSAVIRIQQPRVLVVLDFILAVVEFFVPSLGTLTGREEILDPKNDPLTNSENIVLSGPVYMQTDDVICLSPRRQLIVDGCGIDELTYDGCGKTISLSEQFNVKGESSSGTIIIIGCGKKLRFKNVKIENGALLRKCTYLSNDSSYSVSTEDGVEISFLDNIISDVNREALEQVQGSMKKAGDHDAAFALPPNQAISFTFDVQVVSPELTFFDSSKLAFDDSLQLEKLLRARMDFSFMYSSRENDKWVRSLVKDLTIEAGSGLVILESVDISCGYTSVRDKTNISIISTDICLHISLSVASLLLQLQNQAVGALHVGKANPLASCTNFKRLWVSQKGPLPGYNLSFWRPQPPPNYVVLGDCVTSRAIPPSKAVVAVSNTYGRVRKPLGYKLVGLFSSFQESTEGSKMTDNECSIWMPIPPTGYVAVGCVAHIGSQPPPNHIAYCLRYDLATSKNFSDCVFSVPSNHRVPSGFSIWRTDNIVGSFYAHCSVNSPLKTNSFNLHQILLRNPNCNLPPSNDLIVKSSTDDDDQQSMKGANNNNSPSGWDILRTLSRTSCYASTPHFERIWWDKGCDLRRPISIWRPLPRHGFSILGDCVTEGLEPPSLGLVFKCDASAVSAKPVQFTKVADISGKGIDDAYFWYPIPPPGYASMGCIVTRTDEMPRKDFFCCPRMDLVNQANVAEEPISRSSCSKGSNCWSIWKVENQACTFLARSDLRRPSSRLAYGISDYVKPKTRENICAELKLGCLSISVLDSLSGMMAPLFDTTITNLNLATHGHLEAMNAVLICSMAASTFNRQLEAWEPLVEPFDGIFKVETYLTNEQSTSKVGKRLRFAATTTVNLNVSAANLQTVIESILSWRKQIDLEQKASRKSQDAGAVFKHKHDIAFSALEEDDFQKIIIENKLGCDIFLRKVEQISETIELLQPDNQASLLIPPPRFINRLNVATKSRETRYFVAIHIMESKGVPIADDGNNHDYFCALRLNVDQKLSDQYKLFPQSARTRCVRPVILRSNNRDTGHAKWNELFIFEVPEKELATLEVEVTNLSSKAGKGEVIGALSIPIDNGSNALRRTVSLKILQQAADGHQISSYPLRKKGQLITDENGEDYGLLILSTTYFERKADITFQNATESRVTTDTDVSFWIGLGREGPWESFGSVLPLSVVPKSLDKNPFAFELVLQNGKKHAILRALAVIMNNADVKFEVSVCSMAMLSSSTAKTGIDNSIVVTEEIFENHRYQPISGWGNKSGFRGNDPGHWSTRDFSYSSKDFFEPPLPPGWRWICAWNIEKSQFVDSDGWAYGTDFESLKWPPVSSKSCSKSPQDFVRRRRWTRRRQQLLDKSIDSKRNIVAVVSPGSSAVLPWRSMITGTDLCLQVRPYVEDTQETYTWGQTVTLGSCRDQYVNQRTPISSQNTMKHTNLSSPNSNLKLNDLEKKDILLHCKHSTNTKQGFWFSVGIDASVLHTDLNAAVYDWKLSISSALKLENKLPYQAEYALWEKVIEGNMVERQHGIVSSGGCAFVYSADLRRPIYLTLFVQGGWVLEKDAILLMDLLSLDHASSFWMVQKQGNRRLHVSVERDMGGTDAAPKTVRLFVPYWICNDSSLPLSYRIVEVEQLDNAETDALLISRAVKSAKLSLRHSTKSFDWKNSSLRRNIQIFEVIEDFETNCNMLSPQDYITRSPALSFPSRGDAFFSTRVGISVAIRNSEHYSSGISFSELESKERIDLKAFGTDGSYYKLSAQLNMSSDRTKVVRFLPQTLFINRVGCSVALCQCGTDLIEWFHPADPPKVFKWQYSAKSELLKLRLDGYEWSTPFSIENDGVICIHMKNEKGNNQMHLIVEVRGGTKSSHYEVLFYFPSMASPYRIENRSMFVPLHFRQVDGTDDSWRSLTPNSAASFFWEDLGRQQLLEVLVDGTNPLKTLKLNIDEIMDHQPMQLSGGPTSALRVTVLREGKVLVCRISDWMPENEKLAALHGRVPFPVFHEPKHVYKQSSTDIDNELHVVLELPELGLSIIDHMPEEILYLSLQNLLLSYSAGLGSGISRFKLRMQGIQVDNQLPLTPMPVLFRPQKLRDQLEYLLKFSVTIETNNSLDFSVYPYLGLQVPDNSGFLVNIHEPIIWRLHEMFQQVKLNRILDSPSNDVSVDPVIQIGLLNISEIRFKVSMTMSPTQRPKGVLGFWPSLMTALGNTEHMPVRITQRFCEDVCMRQSALINTAFSNIQKDLLSQPLQLLSGVDILGNASSALGHMSKGVAALSMDKKFIQSRQKQDSKGVEDISDVIREGGAALAKGLFRGVTGIVTKPFEGAKSSGVEGFVQGVGKGLIGAAAQPVSGVLDLLSKTTEGANAVRMKITSAITSEEQLLRRRLPRVIGGDNLLLPYDELKATGQVILQLAESSTFFGQVDLFKVRGKFALSDAYENHFLLPKGKIILITHRRVLFLQQPTNIMAQRKFHPARDPCSVLWDVTWDDLVTMELTHGKKDHPGSPPSRLILYMQTRANESKENIRVVKCSRGTQQAKEIFTSIDRALSTYGPSASKDFQKKKMPRPYASVSTSISHEVFPKEAFGTWSVQEVPASVSINSAFGTVLEQPQPEERNIQ